MEYLLLAEDLSAEIGTASHQKIRAIPWNRLIRQWLHEGIWGPDKFPLVPSTSPPPMTLTSYLGLKFHLTGSILCLENINNVLKISYNSSEKGECSQLLLAYVRDLNVQISSCTLLKLHRAVAPERCSSTSEVWATEIRIVQRERIRSWCADRGKTVWGGGHTGACVQSRRQSTLWGGGGGDPPGALALLKANGFTNLLPVISPFCPVLLQADLERTRKAKRRLE